MKRIKSPQKNITQATTKRLTKDTKTISFDVFSLHSTCSNTSNTKRADIIEELIFKESCGVHTPFNSMLVPMLKVKCLNNFHAELSNIEVQEEYADPRAKRFQILKMLLSDETFVKKITHNSTVSRGPTAAWDKHSMWNKYDFSLEKYDSSLVSFIRFFRNHYSHHYEVNEDFHRNLLKTRRIDDSRFCQLIEKNFPCMLSFLVNLYLSACDEEDLIIPPEYVDLLLIEDFESFLAETITKHFPITIATI